MKTITNITYSALALFALACLALLPQARAVCQEGCVSYSNTALGDDALVNNVGYDNTAIGSQALILNTDGGWNTAVGTGVLFNNTTGYWNTAVGAGALNYNTTGSDNTANGMFALFDNTSANDNTANGYFALSYNTTGASNTAVGSLALFANTTGGSNTSVGFEAMYGDDNNFSTGSNNTGIGYEALFSYTTGNNNIAGGYQALYNNTTGNYNAASGQAALFANTRGSNNTADGQNALGRNTTGSNNIALGSNAGGLLTTGSNNIDIFHRGVAGESNTIRIGKQGTQTATFIGGISGATVPSGVAVIIDSSGHLGTATSSARFKDAIKPMDKASEAILALKPVTFHYKHELDPKGIPQFGLVAEDVEKVNPSLVARDEEGKPYTVRYDAVNAMLLNEFIKARRQIDSQQKQIEALTAGLQKVSAQLEASKPAPQVVNNP
jgi:hypothetical protein